MEKHVNTTNLFFRLLLFFIQIKIYTLLNDYCSIIDVLCVFIVDVSEQTIVL